MAGAEQAGPLLRWMVMGTLVGIAAGLGAVLFARAIGLVTRLALGGVVNFIPPMPVGEAMEAVSGAPRFWLLPIVTAIGGLISGVIVQHWAPEAEGHGTDAAIESIHFKGARVSPKVAVVKLVASAITIGSGGSAGREGPAAQISASIASFLSDRLKLSADDRRIMMASGMGAGIGAIFRAPLGGAIMGAEIMYLHDMEVQVLLPSLIASIVASAVFGSLEGFEPIFGAQPDISLNDPITLIWYAVLGVSLGLAGILYARTFYGTQKLFGQTPIPKWLRPAVGALGVGLIGVAVHGSIHTGYGVVQEAMSSQLLTTPLWLVVVLPFARILTTSLTVGSGGSGGIFGPGMVIGGMFGAAAWRIGEGVLPHMPASPAPFVIVGMMAMFGSIAHAPFAVMLMVAEMTGNLSLLAPAMMCVALASLIVGDETIYRSQVPDRAHSPAHRLRLSFPLLAALTARNAVIVGATKSSGPTIDAERPLDGVLQDLADANSLQATVMEGDSVLGTLTYRSVIDAFHKASDWGAHQARMLPPSVLLISRTIAPNSQADGEKIRQLKLPPGTIIIAIDRQGEMIHPNADTVLHAGDVLSVVVRQDDFPVLDERFARHVTVHGSVAGSVD